MSTNKITDDLKINDEITNTFFGFLEWLRENKDLKSNHIDLIKVHWSVANGRVFYETIKNKLEPRLFPDEIGESKTADTFKRNKEKITTWFKEIELWQRIHGIELLILEEKEGVPRTRDNRQFDSPKFKYRFTILEKLAELQSLFKHRSLTENFKNLIRELKVGLSEGGNREKS